MTRFRISGPSVLLAGTGLMALLLVIARARLQSVTIDEADCYLAFVARPAAFHWEPASQNHILNSVLMRLFTLLFGLSHLSLRAPALIGATIYISAACLLAKLLAPDAGRQWPLLVCLVYNPFILDYLVAARGYSLALAFLMSAIGVVAYSQAAIMNGRTYSKTKTCALCSVGLALSFAANFSFAFVDAAVLLAIFVWACRSGPAPRPSRAGYARLFAACVLPGLFVTLFLCSSALVRWPKGQLWWGVTTLRETVSTVVDASLYQINPQIVNPLLLPALEHLKAALFPLLGATLAWLLVLVFRNRSWPKDAPTKWLLALGAGLGCVVAITLSIHWLAFRLFHLLLPTGRTAIYLAPLCTLIVGAGAAIVVPTPAGRICRRVLSVVLFAFSGYFLLCLRLTYFKEWKWDADARAVYSVLAYYHHAYGISDVGSHWMYVAPLNFYRVLSGHESIREFVTEPEFPPDKQAYVLNGAFHQDFVERHGLKVVYHGDLSDVLVAVRPELVAGPRRPADGAGIAEGHAPRGCNRMSRVTSVAEIPR